MAGTPGGDGRTGQVQCSGAAAGTPGTIHQLALTRTDETGYHALSGQALRVPAARRPARGDTDVHV
jgi:hypothetical protein